ncbi:MAG TPA: acetyl-CoA C-acetyltransferase [Candidatus Krumholzibacteria bacterium]|nr:acetyl-CoA C-acetyltransferase [Candidatus Krumholzibacteria bacterium]
MSKRSVICEAVRTPIGRFQGGLASVRAPELGATCIKAVVARTGLDPAKVDEVIMGCVCQAGLQQNPARQAAIFGGLPATVSAMTVNKVCGSGLKAVALADQAIRAGDKECVIAGGLENMSQIPYALFGARDGLRLGDGKVTDLLVHDGLWDIYNNFHMGMTAEWVVDTYGVSREDQDAYAVRSHHRAAAAWENGEFTREVVPVPVPQRKGDPVMVTRDEGPRADASIDAMAKLKPAFKRDGGTVTAGNASSINDGAAALLVCSEAFAKANGLTIRAYIDGAATGAVEPHQVMMAPVTSIRNLWTKLGTSAADYGLYELNEAFAAQSLGVVRELGLDDATVNVRGGGVSLGHPIGCSGARILVTLVHAMEDRKVARGIASLCLGGGDAVSMAVSLP